TVKVRVALEEKDARLVPDMGVRVSFLEERAAPAAAPPKGVLVPASAIVTRGGRSVVFVVDGDTADQRVVTPATQDYGDLKLIPAGIALGATIIDKPVDALEDGARVEEARK